MHEIITLQLGQFSNYLATHFWNLQESYFTYSEKSPVDHDVHWRAGIGADGSETFLPRTVIYDLKGGFGSLRKINALYEEEDSDGASAHLWKGTPVVHTQKPVSPTAYQLSINEGRSPPKLRADDVRYWSDFSRVYYHPKSIIQLYDYELNSSTMPFNSWLQGRDLFETIDKEHDLVDRDMRPFVEEADRMQGIQVFAPMDDAWGGLAAAYLERLRDEYGKACIWVWAPQQTPLNAERKQRLISLSNVARSLVEESPQTSMLVPLALPSAPLPPSVRLDRSSPWHVSALLTAGLETATLSSRLRQVSDAVNGALWGLVGALNLSGRQSIAKLQFEIAQHTQDRRVGGDTRQPQRDESPGEAQALELEHGIALSTVLDYASSRQGGLADDARETLAFGQIKTSRSGGTTALSISNQPVSSHLERRLPGRSSLKQYDANLELPVLDSCPEIYRSHGDIIVQAGSKLAANALLSTDTSLSNDVKKLRSVITPHIPAVDREALDNGLAEIEDAYREGWSSGSDDDDD